MKILKINILKLYIGLVFASLVFMFENIRYLGFSINSAKAMDDKRTDSGQLLSQMRRFPSRRGLFYFYNVVVKDVDVLDLLKADTEFFIYEKRHYSGDSRFNCVLFPNVDFTCYNEDKDLVRDYYYMKEVENLKNLLKEKHSYIQQIENLGFDKLERRFDELKETEIADEVKRLTGNKLSLKEELDFVLNLYKFLGQVSGAVFKLRCAAEDIKEKSRFKLLRETSREGIVDDRTKSEAALKIYEFVRKVMLDVYDAVKLYAALEEYIKKAYSTMEYFTGENKDIAKAYVAKNRDCPIERVKILTFLRDHGLKIIRYFAQWASPFFLMKIFWEQYLLFWRVVDFFDNEVDVKNLESEYVDEAKNVESLFKEGGKLAKDEYFSYMPSSSNLDEYEREKRIFESIKSTKEGENENDISKSIKIFKVNEEDKIKVDEFLNIDVAGEPYKFLKKFLKKEDLNYRDKIDIDIDKTLKNELKFENIVNLATMYGHIIYEDLVDLEKKEHTAGGLIDEAYYKCYFGDDSNWFKNLVKSNNQVEGLHNRLVNFLPYKIYTFCKFLKDLHSSAFEVDGGLCSGEIGKFLTKYLKEYDKVRQILKKSPEELVEDTSEAKSDLFRFYNFFEGSCLLLQVLKKYERSFLSITECVAEAIPKVNAFKFFNAFEKFKDAWEELISKILIVICGKFCPIIIGYKGTKSKSNSERYFWELLELDDLDKFLEFITKIGKQFDKLFSLK